MKIHHLGVASLNLTRKDSVGIFRNRTIVWLNEENHTLAESASKAFNGMSQSKSRGSLMKERVSLSPTLSLNLFSKSKKT